MCEEGLTGSTGFAVLRPQKSEVAELVYLSVTAPDNIERLAHLADGGAYPAVRSEVVAATGVVVAGAGVARKFSMAVSPLMEKRAANESQSHTLTALRDTLLPRLISGELRIQNVERFLERHDATLQPPGPPP